MKTRTRFITWSSEPGGKRPVRVLRLLSHRGFRLMLHPALGIYRSFARFGVSHEGSGANVARAYTPAAAIRKARAKLDAEWAAVPKELKNHPRINPNARSDKLARR